MSRRGATPPPTPGERARRKKKTLAIVGISLVVLSVVAFFVVPVLVLVTPNPRMQRIVQKVEDMNNVRQMVGVMIVEGTPIAPDGRVDVYAALLEFIDNPQQIVEICTSARTGRGPTIEQIRAGDYSAFPFVRTKGAVTLDLVDRPLLWDPEPREDGERVVGLGNGAARALTEAEFQSLARKFDLE